MIPDRMIQKYLFMMFSDNLHLFSTVRFVFKSSNSIQYCRLYKYQEIQSGVTFLWFNDFACSPHFFTHHSLFLLKFSNLLVLSKEFWRHIYFQFHKSASGWLGEIRFPKLVSPHQWMVKCTQMFFYNLNNFVNESIPLISSSLTSDFSVNSLNNSIIETNRGFKFSTS